MKSTTRIGTLGIAVAGLVAAAAGPASAVLGGSNATTAKNPYMIAIETADGRQLCTGALIAPNKVLSAAHCFENADADTLKGLRFIGGRTDLGGTGGQVRQAKSVKVHPKYAGAAGDYDGAVVTLAKPLPYKTIPVAKPGDTALYKPGTTARFLGWGLSGPRTEPPTVARLKQVDLKLAPIKDKCGPWSSDSKATICGLPRTAKAESICSGDSGGPLIVKGKVIGIANSGNKYCTDEMPFSAFTKVSAVAAGLGLNG